MNHNSSFRAGAKHFDADVRQAGGAVLLVSNFTVAAATRQGRRPSFDAAAEFPEVVRTLVDAGIPVFAQFGLTPQTATKYGIPYSAQNSPAAQTSAEAAAKLIAEAKLLEAAGASLLDFSNSGPIAGAAVAAAVKIPVIGGFGGGPWLDGRVRLVHTAIGYGEKWLEATTETYANTAKAALTAFTALIADARAGRQIKG